MQGKYSPAGEDVPASFESLWSKFGSSTAIFLFFIVGALLNFLPFGMGMSMKDDNGQIMLWL